MSQYTPEQVDLRNLIYADLQFEHRGETNLKLEELQSLVTRGWMREGEENNEFDVTDEGRAVLAATLRQQAVGVDDDTLIDIARRVGLRQQFTGVNATDAKFLLRAFVDALAQHGQPEDSRCPPTYRREEAVKALIGMGWAWDGKQWHGQPKQANAQGEEQAAEVARLQSVIERDRTAFCNLIVQLKGELKSREWLGNENARAAGGYTYNETGFIREFGDAWTEIMCALERAHRKFQDFNDCPRGDAMRRAQAEAQAILDRPAVRAGVPDGWRRAMERALPFLDDEASKYEDDGNNEPLDVSDTIRDLLAATPSAESADGKPSDCSGDPASCPDNEGRGCHYQLAALADASSTESGEVES